MTSPYSPPPVAVPAAARPVFGSQRFALVVAGVLVAATVVNAVASNGFPIAAPVETIYSFGLSVDLMVAALVLGIRALVLWRRPVFTAVDPRPRALPITAAVLGIVSLIAGGISGVTFVAQTLAGERGRYMYASGSLFLVGAAWCLAFIFGVIGLRRGGNRLNSGLAIGALAAAFFVCLLMLAAAIVYGLDLSD